ncbi:MAG: hypothetical protein J5I93_00365, partial [Pirellulaceae bacterium]|nr:hypothetical protein [Pirellulaceae bacterium]
MSDAASEPKSPSLFRRIITWPWRLSMAARAAWCTLLFLLVLVTVSWILFFASDSSVPWRQSMSAGRIVAIVLLVSVIPFAVYYVLRLWLEGERSQFPEIDFAWRSGLETLAQNGISVTSTPIYLVLGSSGERQERDLLAAAGLRMRVEQVPEGPAPLHWYANPEAIFLFCTDTCWLGAQVAIKEKHLLETGGSSFPLVDHSLMPGAGPIPPQEPVAPARQPAAAPL